MTKDNKIINLTAHRSKKAAEAKEVTPAQLLRLIAKEMKDTVFNEGKIIVVLYAEQGEDMLLSVQGSEMSVLEAIGILKLAEQEL